MTPHNADTEALHLPLSLSLSFSTDCHSPTTTRHQGDSQAECGAQSAQHGPLQDAKLEEKRHQRHKRRKKREEHVERHAIASPHRSFSCGAFSENLPPCFRLTKIPRKHELEESLALTHPCPSNVRLRSCGSAPHAAKKGSGN